MKKTILFLAAGIMGMHVMAQKKVTTSAVINFDATTPKDDLPKAVNNTVIASLDPQSGALAFEAQIKSFNFTNAMIQDHFNGEKWMNSEAYPTASFKGTLSGSSDFDLSKDGKYKTIVSGTLTLHGVSNEIKAPAIIEVKEGMLNASADFKVKLSDYKIANSAKGKVADEPKISVTAVF